MQTALHGTEVHTGDLGDLLVTLAFELTEPEDELMMLRKRLDLVSPTLERGWQIYGRGRS